MKVILLATALLSVLSAVVYCAQNPKSVPAAPPKQPQPQPPQQPEGRKRKRNRSNEKPVKTVDRDEEDTESFFYNDIYGDNAKYDENVYDYDEEEKDYPDSDLSD